MRLSRSTKQALLFLLYTVGQSVDSIVPSLQKCDNIAEMGGDLRQYPEFYLRAMHSLFPIASSSRCLHPVLGVPLILNSVKEFHKLSVDFGTV